MVALAYLPTFCIIKAGVLYGSVDPNVWASIGTDNYTSNLVKDEIDLVRV